MRNETVNDEVGPTRFINPETGKEQTCRLEDEGFLDDPLVRVSGLGAEIAEDFRKLDLKDGCPACYFETMGSEPDGGAL